MSKYGDLLICESSSDAIWIETELVILITIFCFFVLSERSACNMCVAKMYLLEVAKIVLPGVSEFLTFRTLYDLPLSLQGPQVPQLFHY